MGPDRVEILGVPLDLVDMTGALAAVDEMLTEPISARCILAVNPEKIINVRHDAWLLNFFRQAALLIPDGIGAVWAARCLFGANIGRVPGVDLMENLCVLAAEKGYKVFFFGAKEEVNAGAVRALKERYPGLNVAGRRNGYLAPDAMDELVMEINRSGAQILFVALGSPRQELWISRYSNQLQVKIIQGIGGSLDAITGHVKRAPLVWRRFNLEWLYRLLNDPRRWRRQLLLPKFALLVFRYMWFCKTN